MGTERVCCTGDSRFPIADHRKEGGSAATQGGTTGVEEYGGSTPCLPCLTGPFRFEVVWCRDFLSLLVFKVPLRMEP